LKLIFLQPYLSDSVMFSWFFAVRSSAFQKLLPGLFESDEEGSQFLQNLLKSSKFVKFVERLFPWYPQTKFHGSKLRQLILGARTDRPGFFQFGTMVPFNSGKLECRVGANPWIRLLLREDDAVASMLERFIIRLVEFARPGTFVTDCDWYDKVLHRGKFNGVLLLLPATRPGYLSHEIFVRVRMLIDSNNGATQLSARDVNLFLEFETNTDFGPVSGAMSQFRDCDVIEFCRIPSSVSDASPPLDSGQSVPISSTATPMVRLNAISFHRRSEHSFVQGRSSDDEEDSPRKVPVRCLFEICMALLFL
jgi:hypothetical protein